MYTHQRNRPTRNATAVSGTASVSSHTDTSTSCASGAIRRPTRVQLNAAQRKHATASTGASARRLSRLARLNLVASRTEAAANSTMVRTSRSGRTTSAMNAGSDPLIMNAFAGHPATHPTPGAGTGYRSTSSAVGR